MILLLTLAGRDELFESQGFRMPKYLLPWGDQAILSAILTEFLRPGTIQDVVLVANSEDEGYMPHVRAIMRARGIPADRLTLTDDTSGQAETAVIGLDAIERLRGSSDAPIVISNVDTILYRRDLNRIADTLRRADGFVDVFRSSDRSYSYVLLDEQDRVREIAEKIVVSDVATSGCYGFRNASTYRAHYSPGDVYISSVFKTMIEVGCLVVAGERHSEEDTIVLADPDQYMNTALVRL